MIKTIIRLPNGTEISSGAGTEVAISNFSLTEAVNTGTELTIGSVCASSIEVGIIDPKGKLSIGAGTRLTVFREYGDSARTLIGQFITEQPTRNSANSMQIVAYDNISCLDLDITDFINSLANWPYKLTDLARLVCAECGLNLITTDIPNGDYHVKQFTGIGITGRQLMQFIGQIAGRFVRATPAGDIEFGWYQPLGEYNIGSTFERQAVQFYPNSIEINLPALAVGDDGEGNLTVTSDLIHVESDNMGNVQLVVNTDFKSMRYLQGGLSFEDYTVAAIEKVQIKQSDNDVGVVFPDGITGSVNTYVILKNPLLVAATQSEIVDVAETLFNILHPISYVPCSVSVIANQFIRAGHIVQVTDINHNTFVTYIMSRAQKGYVDNLKCTGSPSRESTTAVNNQMWSSVNGKLLDLYMNVDGLKVQNRDMQGKYSSLSLDVDGIKTEVAGVDSQLESTTDRVSTLEQSSEQLQLSFEKVETDGVDKVKTSRGYTFDDEGLRITRSGQQMENLLDNTGMYVRRSGQVILQANDRGVRAIDVTVESYLIIGDHARFENYTSGRTACFWLEG